LELSESFSLFFTGLKPPLPKRARAAETGFTGAESVEPEGGG
jgi:hypothetical protein